GSDKCFPLSLRFMRMTHGPIIVAIVTSDTQETDRSEWLKTDGVLECSRLWKESSVPELNFNNVELLIGRAQEGQGLKPHRPQSGEDVGPLSKALHPIIVQMYKKVAPDKNVC
ncbi:MAG: hypothetical protein ACRC4N_13195, partial [Gammaproteobacteria bacterium]